MLQLCRRLLSVAFELIIPLSGAQTSPQRRAPRAGHISASASMQRADC
jgi:hypothetical protein